MRSLVARRAERFGHELCTVPLISEQDIKIYHNDAICNNRIREWLDVTHFLSLVQDCDAIAARDDSESDERMQRGAMIFAKDLWPLWLLKREARQSGMELRINRGLRAKGATITKQSAVWPKGGCGKVNSLDGQGCLAGWSAARCVREWKCARRQKVNCGETSRKEQQI